MKLTICTSFYNVEKYMNSFITQLKNQTNQNFKCILVDDGSTDKSYENCANAIDSDPRFSIIRHEGNKGLGAGRITGLEQAQTEYLTFMDPDDEIETTTIEMLLNDIQNNDSDFIIYDFFTKNEKNEVKTVSDKSVSIEELFKTKSSLISHVWHKVYKKSLLEKMNFSFYKTVSFAEDLWLCVNCFIYADNPIILHKAYYYYKYNSTSLVHKRSEKSIRENIEVLKNLLQNPMLKENKVIEDYIKDDSFHAFGHLIFPNKNNDFQKTPHFEEWRKIDSDIGVYIPKYLSKFVRIYISFIKKGNNIISTLIWLILKTKDKFK